MPTSESGRLTRVTSIGSDAMLPKELDESDGSDTGGREEPERAGRDLITGQSSRGDKWTEVTS